MLPGLEASLLRLLQNYRPGDIGVCEVAGVFQLSMPIPDWATWLWQEEVIDATITAGLAGWWTMWTVPADESQEILHIHTDRTGGDNTTTRIGLLLPADYWAGSAQTRLISLSTASDDIMWPDPSALQANLDRPPFPHPLTLPPLSQLQVYFTGAGVAASTEKWTIVCRRTKILGRTPPVS